MPAMPEGDNWAFVRSVLRFEQELRYGRRRFTSASLAQTGLPSYWQQVLALLEVYRQIHHEGRIDSRFLDCLFPLYQRMVVTRWGPLLSSKGEKS